MQNFWFIICLYMDNQNRNQWILGWYEVDMKKFLHARSKIENKRSACHIVHLFCFGLEKLMNNFLAQGMFQIWFYTNRECTYIFVYLFNTCLYNIFFMHINKQLWELVLFTECFAVKMHNKSDFCENSQNEMLAVINYYK